MNRTIESAWQPAASRAARSLRPRHACGVAVAVACLLHIAPLGVETELDGHEVLVAQTAREMLTTGDWVIPHFAGKVRFEKPPLAYWLAACSYQLTGEVSPATARLPTALFSMAGVALVTWVGAHWFGPSAGLAAGLIQTTTYWTLLYGRSALIDVTLTTVVSAAMLLGSGLPLGIASLTCGRRLLLFWSALGLAVLAKGPLAPALVLPALGLCWALDRRWPRLAHLVAPLTLAGFALFLFLALAWPVAVALRYPEAISLWKGQTLDRFAVHWGPNSRPWYYYLYQIPALTLPWAPFWIVRLLRQPRRLFARWKSRDGTSAPSDTTMSRAGDDDRSDSSPARAERFLWVWAGVTFVFFTFSQGKREHYILPGLPPLSLLAAREVWRARGSLAFRRRHPGNVAMTLGRTSMPSTARWIVVSLVGSLAALVVVPVVAVGLLGLAALVSGWHWLTMGRMRYAAGAIGALVAAIVVGELAVVSGMRGRPETRALIARQRDRIQEAEKILQYGSNDRSLAFLVNRPMEWLRAPDDLTRELAAGGPCLILVPEARLEEVAAVYAVREIDRMAPSQARLESDPKSRFVLVEPVQLVQRPPR